MDFKIKLNKEKTIVKVSLDLTKHVGKAFAGLADVLEYLNKHATIVSSPYKIGRCIKTPGTSQISNIAPKFDISGTWEFELIRPEKEKKPKLSSPKTKTEKEKKPKSSPLKTKKKAD